MPRKTVITHTLRVNVKINQLHCISDPCTLWDSPQIERHSSRSLPVCHCPIFKSWGPWLEVEIPFLCVPTVSVSYKQKGLCCHCCRFRPVWPWDLLKQSISWCISIHSLKELFSTDIQSMSVQKKGELVCFAQLVNENHSNRVPSRQGTLFLWGNPVYLMLMCGGKGRWAGIPKSSLCFLMNFSTMPEMKTLLLNGGGWK